MNKKLLVIIISCVVILFICGLSYFMLRLGENNCSKCKKCDECKTSEINQTCDNVENTTFGEKYFNMFGSNDYDIYKRGNYILNEYLKHYVSPYDFQVTDEYKTFVTKLNTEYGSKSTYFKSDTTYSINDPYDTVYLTFKTDGTYSGKINECEGYPSTNGTYKIFNDELLILNFDSNNNDRVIDMMFLYKDDNIIQSITFQDCNAIRPGALLIGK